MEVQFTMGVGGSFDVVAGKLSVPYVDAEIAFRMAI